jgi:acetoin utilization deacetylase AcuC-like enzyme
MQARARALRTRVGRWIRGHALAVWYDPAYRLPLASIEASTGMDPRRADQALTYLSSGGFVALSELRTPSRIRYEDLARVHTPELLESLQDAEAIARAFAVDASDIVVDEVVNTIRIACGGTLDAARQALASGARTLNLMGGFHHAGPARGGGFCIVNDIAVAIAALRAEGFRKRIVVLDLDAHPPDGTAECVRGDPSVWIGSLSGADWGPLERVDETVLPRDCDDGSYLSALGALLSRMPPAGLAIVLAGGDVLRGDRFGAFALTLDGARQRDLAVCRRLGKVPSVWLPAGGYTPDAWRVLAGTGMVLSSETREPIPDDIDPTNLQFSAVAHQLEYSNLEGSELLTSADLMADLEPRFARAPRFLGFYTPEGIEYALSRYGVLRQLRRLGYSRFRVALDRDERGDRLRLFGRADEEEHLLIECVLEKRRVFEEDVLYVHWLTLRHPRGRFSPERPRLPGQEEPGLGLAKEAGLLFARSAERLGLAGIAFRPAWLHTAYAARGSMQFVDPARQGRFEALLRDLGHLPLLVLTRAIAEGRVRMNGERYTWEADEMVYWLAPHPRDRDTIEREAARVRFALDDLSAR